MPVRRLALTTLAALTLVLGGCATPGAGEPGGIVDGEFAVEAAWLDGGRAIALVTQGSSSCVPIAADVTVGDDGALEVALEDPQTDGCSDDLAPRATLVGVPEGVAAADELEIRVSYGIDSSGEADLDAYAGGDVAEFTPSAGVVGDDLIALLTWGSSSCAPVVAAAEFDGEATVVEFETPVSDQVCTMDMAPRVTLIPGSNVGEASTVILTGGAEYAEPLTVPLAG